MGDNCPGGSDLPKTIDLKLYVGEKAYDSAKHCIFCLEEGNSFNPLLKLSSSENGRTKIHEVI